MRIQGDLVVEIVGLQLLAPTIEFSSIEGKRQCTIMSPYPATSTVEIVYSTDATEPMRGASHDYSHAFDVDANMRKIKAKTYFGIAVPSEV